MGQEFSLDDRRVSINNICVLIETTLVQTVIIDHHLLRDQEWKEEIEEVFVKTENTVKGRDFGRLSGSGE
jgi:predicted metallo-beta-lactamase superfamily hydrolase